MATLSVSPSRIPAHPASTTRTVTFIGIGTSWLSSAPTFTPSGVSGVSCGTVTVVSDTKATAPVTTGTATGTATWTDSTTSATARQAVGASALHFVPRRPRAR